MTNNQKILELLDDSFDSFIEALYEKDTNVRRSKDSANYQFWYKFISILKSKIEILEAKNDK